MPVDHRAQGASPVALPIHRQTSSTVKTRDQLIAEGERHQQEVAWREQRWLLRRQRFIKRAVVLSAILYALGFRLQAYGGFFDWWLWLPTLVVGGLAAWPIARWRLGPLLGAPLYGGIAMGWEIIVFAFKMADLPGRSFNPGGVLLMVSAWGFWAIYGCILGVIANQDDDDTIQI